MNKGSLGAQKRKCISMHGQEGVNRHGVIMRFRTLQGLQGLQEQRKGLRLDIRRCVALVFALLFSFSISR